MLYSNLTNVCGGRHRGVNGQAVALLNSKVLVLNRSYLPVHVTSVKRAFALLYQGIAEAVDEQYRTFDFDSWRDLAIEMHHERLGIVGGFIRVPRVLLLVAYERVPKRHVRFSRFNIFARDNNTCQYCGKRFSRTELNLDHVNAALAGRRLDMGEHRLLLPCLQSTQGRAHSRAVRMMLIRKPRRPRMDSVHAPRCSASSIIANGCRSSHVDSAYWNTELRKNRCTTCVSLRPLWIHNP